MTSRAVGWLQKRAVPLRALMLTVPGLLIGSTISSMAIHSGALLFKLLRGPIAILLGVLTTVLSRRAVQPAAVEQIPESAGIPLFLNCCVGGLITGWIAIGEGELVAALLMRVCGVSIAACVGLGAVWLAINSMYLALLHRFFLAGIPWSITDFTGPGRVIGAGGPLI